MSYLPSQQNGGSPGLRSMALPALSLRERHTVRPHFAGRETGGESRQVELARLFSLQEKEIIFHTSLFNSPNRVENGD